MLFIFSRIVLLFLMLDFLPRSSEIHRIPLHKKKLISGTITVWRETHMFRSRRIVLSLIVLFVFALFYTWIEQAEARRMGGGRSFGSSPSYQRSAPSPTSPQRSPSQTAPANPLRPCGCTKAIWRNARRTPHGWAHRLPPLRRHAQLGWSGTSGYSDLRRASLLPFPLSQGKTNGDPGSRSDIFQHRPRFPGNLGFCRPRIWICSGNAGALLPQRKSRFRKALIRKTS